MPYVENFDLFLQQAEALYRRDPLNTRYVTKYRSKEGVLVLKVTDDKQCLMFKTDQAADLKKLERVNALFFTLTGRAADADPDELMTEAPPPQASAKASAAPRPQGGGKGGGGGKGRR